MTEELLELQNRIEDLQDMRIKNPEVFHNSVMEGILMGLLEAQEIFEKKND